MCLRDLANNLYSRFISISQDDLEEMKNETKLEICSYLSQFEENLKSILEYEKELIIPLLKLINVSETISKKLDIQKPDNLMQSLNVSCESMMESINEMLRDEMIRM